MLDNPHIGYVDDFADYTTDFKAFMEDIVSQKTTQKPNLLCHSMGGAIGALTVLHYPDMFAKVAFSAPMFGLLPALPNWLAKVLLGSHRTISGASAYFFGQKDYESEAFSGNNLTQSKTRYDIFRQEYQALPQVKLGGVSGHWLKAAIQAIDEIELKAPNFPIPALVVQAGADTIVDNKRQRRVAENMANTKLLVVEGSRHELLEEQDKYRVPSLTAILDFFK